MMDARNDGKSIWTLSAHSEGVNGLSLSSQCPGLLVTGKVIIEKSPGGACLWNRNRDLDWTFKKHFQLCLALIDTPHRRTSL